MRKLETVLGEASGLVLDGGVLNTTHTIHIMTSR